MFFEAIFVAPSVSIIHAEFLTLPRNCRVRTYEHVSAQNTNNYITKGRIVKRSMRPLHTHLSFVQPRVRSPVTEKVFRSKFCLVEHKIKLRKYLMTI